MTDLDVTESDAAPRDANADGAEASASGRTPLRTVWSVLTEAVREWIEHGVPARGAALAYYVLLSLGPLLVLLVGVLEFLLTGVEVRARLLRAIRTGAGPRAVETASTVLERIEIPDLFSAASLLTLGLLVFGATAAFANLRDSLNAIWGVEPDPDSKGEMALALLTARLRGFVMVMVTGLVITISFVITSIAGLAARYLEAWLPAGALVVHVGDAVVSFVVLGLLFAAVFRTLPAVRIEWSTVWVGAYATALLFVFGKAVVSLILSSASWTSYYGPGASVVTFLAWIYFSAQIFYLGAEFTKVWSRRRGGVMSRLSA